MGVSMHVEVFPTSHCERDIFVFVFCAKVCSLSLSEFLLFTLFSIVFLSLLFHFSGQALFTKHPVCPQSKHFKLHFCICVMKGEILINLFFSREMLKRICSEECN